MAKKHKAKGNQQKPHKRKNFKDNNPRNGSGPSTRAFSMRDEVLNTERHHSEWSPAVRLRHQTISFVSAGSMQPLEEAQIEAPEPFPTEMDVIDGQDRLDSDLENSNGAMAQMNIQGPTAQSTDGQVYVHMDTEKTAAPISAKSAQQTQRLKEEDLFFVDSAGDKSLIPSGPPPVIRDISPVESDSQEEVIVFRGRKDHLAAQEGPVRSRQPSTNSMTPASVPTVKSLPPPASLSAEAGSAAVQLHSSATLAAQPYVPTGKALREAGFNVESARQVAATALQESRDTKRSSQAKKQAKNKCGRAAQRVRSDLGSSYNGMMRDLGGDMEDIDEALYQDYVANTSGMEDLMSGVRQQSESEWISSEMGEEDGDEDLATAIAASLQDANGVSKKTYQNSLPVTDVEMTDASAFTSGWEGEIEDHLPGERDGGDEDDEDYEDEDGTSDPGDDSSLEDELEYTADERWEDEEDLRQRRIDALTDEEIARILAKQEDLGMGSEEILLLDETAFGEGDLSEAQAGLDAILANPSHPSRGSRRKGKKNDHFPSASLMADVLDQDPYNGFDVMDFDRPSLRSVKGKKGRNSAGPLPEELVGLSDDELISDLQSAWVADRQKKAMRKMEREERRNQGLLGKKNKFKPDPAMKFAEGLSMAQLRRELEDFLDDDDATTKAFPPMDKRERKLLHEIANVFDVTSNSKGSGATRFTIFSKRARTPDHVDASRWARAERIASRGFLKAAGKPRKGRNEMPQRAGRGGGFSKAAVGYANGEVVGAAAPEIGESNFGRKLMEKMGWEKGMALGKGGEGMLLPVEARVKSGRGGLG